MDDYSFGFDYENDSYSNPKNKYAPKNLFDEQEDDEQEDDEQEDDEQEDDEEDEEE